MSTSVETRELGSSVNGRGGPARFDPAVSGRGGGGSGGEHQQFRPDVEGLRAVAIVLVVLYHVHAGLAPGGYVGVDVFFVISGFLITGQLVRELRTTGRISFLAFYARQGPADSARGAVDGVCDRGGVGVAAQSSRRQPRAARRPVRDLFRGERSLCGPGRRLFQRRAFSVADPALLVLVGRGAVLHRLAAGAGRLVLDLAWSTTSEHTRASSTFRDRRRDRRPCHPRRDFPGGLDPTDGDFSFVGVFLDRHACLGAGGGSRGRAGVTTRGSSRPPLGDPAQLGGARLVSPLRPRCSQIPPPTRVIRRYFRFSVPRLRSAAAACWQAAASAPRRCSARRRFSVSALAHIPGTCGIGQRSCWPRPCLGTLCLRYRRLP